MWAGRFFFLLREGKIDSAFWENVKRKAGQIQLLIRSVLSTVKIKSWGRRVVAVLASQMVPLVDLGSFNCHVHTRLAWGLVHWPQAGSGLAQWFRGS